MHSCIMHRRSSNILKKIITASFSLLSLSAITIEASAQTKVIGYIPSYQNLIATLDKTDLTKLTHINLAFLNPAPNGQVANNGAPVCMQSAYGGNVTVSELAYVVQKAHDYDVKVLVSLAGGGIPSCSGNWATLLKPENRQNVANNLVQFVNDNNLDGLDIDIEGALMANIDNQGNYTPFIQALRNGLGNEKLLTAATGSYVGGMVPTSSLPYFDFLNLMSYDAVGPYWGNVGDEHSTYNQALTDIQTWQARGLSKDKLVLGVPFYGYGFGSYTSYLSFDDIINQFGEGALETDVIGSRCSSCSYVTYNGIPTIKRKTQLALDQGSGIMIWEMSYNTASNHSLLSAIDSVIKESENNDNGNSGSCDAWVAYQQYYTGDVVSFEGNYYVAEHDNPGYIPTVSTYFWEPIDASECEINEGFSLLIQAEDFTNMSGVDVEATNDTDGGLNVGWIDAGDWMSYANITFPETGTYRIEYRVASTEATKLSLDLNAGSIQLGEVAVPATGGWQNWVTVSHEVDINSGTYDLGVFAPQGGWNINWINITKN